jgi:hypothetical protein
MSHLLEFHDVDVAEARLQLDLSPHLLRAQPKVRATAGSSSSSSSNN